MSANYDVLGSNVVIIIARYRSLVATSGYVKPTQGAVIPTWYDPCAELAVLFVPCARYKAWDLTRTVFVIVAEFGVGRSDREEDLRARKSILLGFCASIREIVVTIELSTLTVGTYTEKIESIGYKLKVFLIRHFLGSILQPRQVHIEDSSAFDTDEVGVGIGLVAIVSLASVWKPQLENLTQRFDEHDISRNRRMTHTGKIDFELLRNILHTRVALAFRQDSYDGESPRSHFMVILAQLAYHRATSELWVSHLDILAVITGKSTGASPG